MDSMPEKTRETITKYLGDLHALESHGLQAIARQAEEVQSAEHPEAHRAIQNFKKTIEDHVKAVETRLTALGGSTTSPIKDAAATVAGVAAGLYNKTRTEKVSKSLRDDYTFISHTAVAYLMFHTTSMSLGDDESARLAERNYRDAARMVMEIDHILPKVVIEELRQDGAQARDVAEHCRKMVHDAWNRNNAFSTSGMASTASGSYSGGISSGSSGSSGSPGSSGRSTASSGTSSSSGSTPMSSASKPAGSSTPGSSSTSSSTSGTNKGPSGG